MQLATVDAGCLRCPEAQQAANWQMEGWPCTVSCLIQLLLLQPTEDQGSRPCAVVPSTFEACFALWNSSAESLISVEF